MSALELYFFLFVTFGHYVSLPLWLKRFATSEFSCLEEYLFYAVFFSVGSFYVVLHFIWLLGGISLWKGLIVISILHFCLWQPFVKITSFRHDKPDKLYSVKFIDIVGFIFMAATIGQWLNLAYQHDGISGFDAYHYHMPHIANFAGGEPFFGLLPTPHIYPMAHALLGSWLFLGFGSPLVVDWLNIPAFVLIIASFSLFFRLLTNRSGFIWAFLIIFIIFSSQLLELATEVSADLSNASSYLVLFTILTSIIIRQQLNRLEWVGLALSLGLVIGSKSYGLPLVFMTIAIFVLLRLTGLFKFRIIIPNIKYILLYILLFIFSGGIWLFRNWYLFGSPIAPAGISIFGVKLFHGVTLDYYKYCLSVLKDMRDIPNYNFLHHLFLSSQKWYGSYYLFLYAFSGVLFLDSFLSRCFSGKTIINANETISVKYGLLILYISTFLLQGYLLIRAPFSSLSIFNGGAVRYMLPLVLCSFPLFFSFVIPKKSTTGIRDYSAWIAALALLLINFYLYRTTPYNGIGLVQYPSLLWICLAAVPFIAWALRAYGFYRIKAIYALPLVLVLLTLFYGDMLEKSFEASANSKSAFNRDVSRYTSSGETESKYQEIVLKMSELEQKSKFSCMTKRFFLLSRFDFPLYLLGPLYDHRVSDIHTGSLREGARKIGFRFEPNKYCEFLIVANKLAPSNEENPKDIDIVKSQVADFLPDDARILKAFCTTNYTVYQVSPKTISIDLRSLKGSKKILKDGTLYKPWGGTLTSEDYFFQTGHYRLEIVGKGTELNGINCHLKIFFGPELIHQCFLSKDEQSIEIFFECREDKFEKIVIDFINDASNAQTREDRNIELKSILIKAL